MIGPTYARRLAKLNIKTVEDLIYHFPHRYENFSLVSEIFRIQPGETLTIKGEILSIKNEYTKTGKKIQKALVSDGTGKVEIIWFNQPFLIKTFKIGEWYYFSGKVDWFGKDIALISPEYEKIKSPINKKSNIQLITENIHTGRLVPIYPETSGISSKWLRSRIAYLLDKILPSIEDFMPKEITQTYNLLDLSHSLRYIHFPYSKDQVEKSRQRLAFDELFLIHLTALKKKKDWQKKSLSHKFYIDEKKKTDFISSLPFELTNAQKRCIQEILNDLSLEKPMNRLLEGDVGSGKTVVAAAAIYTAYYNGFQSVLMAPTEILANQHYQTLNKLLSPYGVKISLLTSSRKEKNGEGKDVFVGTHALIQKKVKFEKLGLVIIDEQHRFGVEQRGELAKKGKMPHILTMTATPIPRTIALTLYGNLDLSILDEMPPGRQKVKTWVVPPAKREKAYNWIREKVKETDEQCFIVCPLIEESESLKSVKAAKAEFEILSKKIFPDLRLGLLHGKLKSKEKEEIIQKFRQGEFDILVSTPVVEVGIDIPNATIMVIEGADRFGLAQLHQLRGRVGRGDKQSYCLLFSQSTQERTIQRLKALEKIYIGAELAELDLKIRGPGEIYGTAQHGFPNLKVASFSDINLIRKTKEAAEKTINCLDKFPLLRKKLSKYIIETVLPN